MKIRAITLGVPITLLRNETEDLGNILYSIANLKEKFKSNGIAVETIRLCTPPFNQKTSLEKNLYFKEPDKILSLIDDLISQKMLDYYSFFPGLCDQTEQLTETQKKILSQLPELLQNHENLFSSIQVSSVSGGINLQAIMECAVIIRKLAKINPFLNLRFATTFNVPQNTPFFPSAYHLGNKSKISIALEAADEIVKIMNEFSVKGHNLDWIRLSIQ
ncbi:MAG: DUF711 family protein, partial [Promethearchaeota archaeon]